MLQEYLGHVKQNKIILTWRETRGKFFVFIFPIKYFYLMYNLMIEYIQVLL